MPKNQFQRMTFAFLTVLVTVHAYVFYSLYVVNGNTLTSINGTSSVIEAIGKQGGVYMLGNFLPIWSIILIEFILAFSLEIFIGSPMSFKLTTNMFNSKKTHPVIFETAA